MTNLDKSTLICIRMVFIATILAINSPQAQTDRPVTPLAATTESIVSDQLGGQISAVVNNKPVVLPLLTSEYSVSLHGDIATVDLTQVFANPLSETVNASYLFPLSNDAAVHRMRLTVANEILEAKIDTVEEATQTFQAAKAKGKSAALLKQHRPNMFTQDVANLMPGYPVTVTLRYTQTVPRIDGDYVLTIPTVVGPRYQPSMSLPAAIGSRATISTPLPPHPPVQGINVPNTVDRNRLALEVDLRAGMAIVSAHSPTHGLVVDAEDESHWRLGLDTERVLANRDFELRYSLAADTIQTGVLSERDAHGGYVSLLIEPPVTVDAGDITIREMVFVLDASGSMSGLPMQASKAFMRAALGTLRPTDTFRIIRFSDTATEFARQPLPATPLNVQRGLDYTDRLSGSGGTVMTSGIRQALEVPIAPGSIRLVTFLTDGYIGNEAEILALIHDKIGSARLFALGVGTAPNRFLLDEMAIAGRGFVRYMDPTEDVNTLAEGLAERLRAPLLTNVIIDWGDLDVDNVFPAKIPDLFAGDSVRVLGKYRGGGEHVVTVRGLSAEGEVSYSIPVPLTSVQDNRSTVDTSVNQPTSMLGIIWARAAVRDAMQAIYRAEYDAYAKGGDAQSAQRIASLKKYVTSLGLNYSLVTKWTAFVAVSERVYNPVPEDSVDAVVPLERVDGTSIAAYGESQALLRGVATTPKQRPVGGGFVGSSTPEPQVVFGLLGALSALMLLLFRQHYFTPRR